jgi:hypothetical protein
VAEAATRPEAALGLKSPAALLGLLLLATYAYFLPAPAWNESSRFALVRSLVERQRLDIDPFHITTQDKAFRAGHYYSDKAPGAAFLAVPAYAAYYGWLRLSGAPLPQAVPESVLRGGAPPRDPDQEQVFLNDTYRRAVYLCNLSTNGLAGAALGVLFFVTLAAGGLRPGLALTCTAALAAGTSWFAYSTLFFGHVLAGAFLFGAFVVLGPWFEAPHRARGPARRLLGAGGLLGLAVLCELPAALGVAALGVYALARRPRGQRGHAAGMLALGMGPPILLLAAYQLAAFGSPFSSGYSHLHDPTFAEGMSRGILGVSWPRPGALWGMLVGRSRGLLYLSPVLALGFFGLGRALWTGRARREAALAAVVVASFLLMSAGYYMWWGGAALGPRHVVTALPFLALGIPWAFGASPGDRLARGGVLVLAGLLAISMINQVGAVAVSPLVPFGPDVLVDHVYGHLRRGEVAILAGSANGGLLLGLPGAASLFPLLLLWLLGLGAIRSFWSPAADELQDNESPDGPGGASR